MLCDDSSVMRRLLKGALTATAEFDVVYEAENGKEAVDNVGRIRPDIVVLDVEMPVMDGIDAARALRRRCRTLPIIMFSSLTSQGAAATMEALAAGANDFAIKPTAQIVKALKAKYPDTPIIAFPRQAGENYIGFAKKTGADCVALDNSVSPDWAARNVQVDGCVQGNLASYHMVSGGQPLIDETRAIVKAFSNGPHIFNLGHGIRPETDPANVERLVKRVRDA